MTAATGRLAAPLLAGLIALLAAAISLRLLGPELIRLAEPAAAYDTGRMVLLHSNLPRIAVALLCGAALALSGTILQQVLRNPLASPTTLGFSAGGHLALAVATLFAPALIGIGRDFVALAGSGAAALLVFGMVARRGFAPLSLILSGLIVSLYCGALASILILLNDRYLVSLFIWGGGSLAQQDWSVVLGLMPRLVLLAVLAGLLLRPLALLDLDEAGARALGVRVQLVRVAGIGLAVTLAAMVTSAVGVIGFIGLVAPNLARLAGARRLRDQFVWAPLIGAALLWLTDQAVQWFAGPASAFLPTGAVTALLGSPLLLLMLPRLRVAAASFAQNRVASVRSLSRPGAVLALLAIVLVLTAGLNLLLGRDPDGAWAFLSFVDFTSIAPFRAPRIAAALFAGAMLAVAGTVLQRLTDNPMASPEVLGISAGATLGVMAGLFLLASPAYGAQAGFASAGALIVLVAIVILGRSSGFAPERLLLAGIALGALMDAVVGVLSATGDPRAVQLLRWMSGSTYGTDAATAAITATLALTLIPAALLTRRWLDLLPLGEISATARGLNIPAARLVLLLLAAALSAIATMVVGPLSFVGLMAPHIAREFGLRHAAAQLAGAALAGGALMVAADFIGRTIAFPYEIPAGLVSALIGAPFLMLLLNRRAR